MKSGWLVILVLAGIAVWGLTGFASDPVLYAPEKDPIVSPFHVNPEILRHTPTNSTDYVTMMQYTIDDHEPIVAAFAVNDIGSMETGLSYYSQNLELLRSAVTVFGVGGGEVFEFVNGTQDQGTILSGLAVQGRAMDALVAARDKAGNDTSAQSTIASQVVAVNGKERVLINRYFSDHVVVLRVSKKIGLDTRAYERARTELELMFGKIVNGTTPAPPPEKGKPQEPGITLIIEPHQAVYRDTVQVFGLATPAGREITVLLDNATFASVTTDSSGNYLTVFPVERITSGNHTFVARAGNLTSPGQVLTVGLTGTMTTLTAVPGYHNWSEPGVFCNGTVMANVPVRNANMTILADGLPVLNTTTAENGTFHEFLPLPKGSHTIMAQFPAEGYPLGSSESLALTVVVPATPVRLIDILVIAGAILAAAICVTGAWLFLHRREAGSRASMFDEEALEGILPEAMGLPAVPVEPDIPPEAGALLARYEAMLREHGLSDAARRAYLDLAGRIAKSLRVKGYRTLTPREMSGACAKRSYGGIFDLFVESYERIRYGGSAEAKDREGLEEELQAADQETGREQP